MGNFQDESLLNVSLMMAGSIFSSCVEKDAQSGKVEVQKHIALQKGHLIFLLEL